MEKKVFDIPLMHEINILIEKNPRYTPFEWFVVGFLYAYTENATLESVYTRINNIVKLNKTSSLTPDDTNEIIVKMVSKIINKEPPSPIRGNGSSLDRKGSDNVSTPKRIQDTEVNKSSARLVIEKYLGRDQTSPVHPSASASDTSLERKKSNDKKIDLNPFEDSDKEFEDLRNATKPVTPNRNKAKSPLNVRANNDIFRDGDKRSKSPVILKISSPGEEYRNKGSTKPIKLDEVFDDLLSENNIDPSKLKVYSREMSKKGAVESAQIKKGSANSKEVPKSPYKGDKTFKKGESDVVWKIDGRREDLLLDDISYQSDEELGPGEKNQKKKLGAVVEEKKQEKKSVERSLSHEKQSEDKSKKKTQKGKTQIDLESEEEQSLLLSKQPNHGKRVEEKENKKNQKGVIEEEVKITQSLASSESSLEQKNKDMNQLITATPQFGNSILDGYLLQTVYPQTFGQDEDSEKITPLKNTPKKKHVEQAPQSKGVVINIEDDDEPMPINNEKKGVIEKGSIVLHSESESKRSLFVKQQKQAAKKLKEVQIDFVQIDSEGDSPRQTFLVKTHKKTIDVEYDFVKEKATYVRKPIEEVIIEDQEVLSKDAKRKLQEYEEDVLVKKRKLLEDEKELERTKNKEMSRLGADSSKKGSKNKKR